MALNKIPTQQLGRGGPHVSAIGFGTMGFATWYGRTDDEAAYKALTYSADRGMTFWDTADIYGDSERVLGKWFKETGQRADIFLATKFGGNDPDTPMRGLTPISTLSYYQHRVDPKVPIEVVLEALRGPLEDGTIRWLDLGECSAAVLRRARAVPGIGRRVVVACQMEFSPLELGHEKSGLVKAAGEEGVAVVAYGALGRGMISGQYRSPADFDEGDLRLIMPRFSETNFAKNLGLVDKFKLVVDTCSATPSQIALAFEPISGCRSSARVEENAHAAELVLEPEDVRAIRALVKAADVHGERLPKEYMHTNDCIPFEEWKGE